MKEAEINKLISDQVDEIEDTQRKQFIREILRFERGKMDREQPHYKNTYHDLIEDFALSNEEE